MKVLSVNRSATTRKVISCTLGRLGHSVIDAADCREAVSVLESGQFDGIIFDVGAARPDADFGAAVFFGKREANPVLASIPLLVLVERADPSGRSAAEKIGAAGIVEKPFPEENLVFAVTRCFSQSRPAQMKIG